MCLKDSIDLDDLDDASTNAALESMPPCGIAVQLEPLKLRD